ncbi:hypothetical protein PhCBS80983_g02085 [Powellomyces hirtus]|uniref:Uncharacterized protein n=1 Tax=Powellomyces hirtus TaxID=109895 RepID=A0A507EAH0_9FUNG|nr:hypothetical protein PhCBS80983_g02085 [Powellomyces hirtus]
MRRNTRKPAAATAAATGEQTVSPTKGKGRAGNGGIAPPKPALTQITAKDGQVYTLDDFVYLAPDVANEPYYVGRVLEITVQKLPGKQQTFVKLGWFYRPKDVLPGGNKKNHDPRLLLASMHSDINPVSSIRGKCRVSHIHHVKDLDQWKEEDDCFYYEQLYDRYTHRVYDVVPLELVMNLPTEVSRALCDYKFILVESGKASDFTERRVCNSCDRWCNPDESVVKCMKCRAAFHLGCVGFGKKLPKGYAWQCAKCNKKAVDAAEEEEKTLEKANRGKPVKKVTSLLSYLKEDDEENREPEIEVPTEEVMEQVILPLPVVRDSKKPTWPYRYFGEYAKYRETLAEEGPDRGHPKAASRIGRQFQAELPECEPYPNTSSEAESGGEECFPGRNGAQGENAMASKAPSKSTARGRTQKKGKALDIEGINEAVDLPNRASSEERTFCKPQDLSDKQIAQYLDRIQDEMPTNLKCSDYLYNRALYELHKANYDTDAALKVMIPLRSQELGVPTWTEAEIKAFEVGIAKYGHELTLVHHEVPSKSMTEIVAFFYKWKKGRRYAPVYSQFCKKYRPSKRFKGQKHAMDGAADVEGNLSGDLSEDELPPSPSGKHKHIECANCWVTESPKWKFRQKEHKKEILCLTCGIHYLKYGAPRHITDTLKKSNRENAAKKPGKRKRSFEPPQNDGEKKTKKRGRKAVVKISTVEAYVQEDTPLSPSPDPNSPRPCGVCSDLYEYAGNEIISCIGCKLRVHRDCYGVPSTVTAEDFKCARCQNIQSPECAVLYSCVLCPMVNVPKEAALRRTIGNNWVHVSCATWMPEVKFGNPKTVEPVECIGLIDKKRWKQTCTICKQSTGACITCSERNCSTSFHVSCARYAGWELSIESVRGAKGLHELQAVSHCPRHDRRGGVHLTAESLQALGSAVTSSSLHQPTRLVAPTYYSQTPLDQIDHTLSRPRLVREFISTHKSKAKHFATGGQVRAYSMALQGTCSCHICTEPPPAPVPPPAPPVHKSNVILISMGGEDGPRYMGRKGSSGIIHLPPSHAAASTAASDPPKPIRRKSSVASTQVKVTPSPNAAAPSSKTSSSVTRCCVDCKKTISPAWWKKAEIERQVKEKIAELERAELNSGAGKKRKSIDGAQRESHSSPPSTTSSSSPGGAEDPEVLGRGMRKRRKSSVMLDFEEVKASSSSRNARKTPELFGSNITEMNMTPEAIVKPLNGTSVESTARASSPAKQKSPEDDSDASQDSTPSPKKVKTESSEDASEVIEWICHSCMWQIRDGK